MAAPSGSRPQRVAAIVAAVFAPMACNDSGGFSWYLYGPHNIAGTLGNGSWGYIVGTHDKDAGRCLNDTRLAQKSDKLPVDLNSASLGIGRHVSGIADPSNGHSTSSGSPTSSVPTVGSRRPGTT